VCVCVCLCVCVCVSVCECVCERERERFLFDPAVADAAGGQRESVCVGAGVRKRDRQ
jgi:hypothetical protein